MGKGQINIICSEEVEWMQVKKKIGEVKRRRK